MADTEVLDTPDIDDEAPALNADGTPVKRTRSQPAFSLKRIGEELPPEPERAKPFSRRKLFDNLLAIQADPGIWYEVGEWAAVRQAEKVYALVQDGSQPIPPGRYEMKTQRRNSPETGKRVSVLMAKFVD